MNIDFYSFLLNKYVSGKIGNNSDVISPGAKYALWFGTLYPFVLYKQMNIDN